MHVEPALHFHTFPSIPNTDKYVELVGQGTMDIHPSPCHIVQAILPPKLSFRIGCMLTEKSHVDSVFACLC